METTSEMDKVYKEYVVLYKEIYNKVEEINKVGLNDKNLEELNKIEQDIHAKYHVILPILNYIVEYKDHANEVMESYDDMITRLYQDGLIRKN